MKAEIRICSLLPSTTEIVCELGLQKNLVGITHECDYPSEILDVQVVTKSLIDHTGSTSSQINTHISEALHKGSGIYAIDNEALSKVDPTMILTQELCEVCAVSYTLVEESVRTLGGDQKILSFEPSNLAGILDSILQIGKQTNTESKASEIVDQSHSRLDFVKSESLKSPKTPRVLGLEWLDPPFIGGHWVPEMIEYAGGVEAISLRESPSREIKWEEAIDASPDLVILMVCGFDLEITVAEFHNLSKDKSWGSDFWETFKGDTYIVDGSSYFSRPGPRIVDGLEILAEIIQPEIFPRARPSSDWVKIAK